MEQDTQGNDHSSSLAESKKHLENNLGHIVTFGDGGVQGLELDLITVGPSQLSIFCDSVVLWFCENQDIIKNSVTSYGNFWTRTWSSIISVFEKYHCLRNINSLGFFVWLVWFLGGWFLVFLVVIGVVMGF